jgi:uncharacterized protein
MTIQDLRDQNLIIFECISGSRAYNLHTVTSDTDIKGVFVLPQDAYYGLDYIEQVNNETNDIVFYELGRFIELLLKNNPNLLEMMAVSEEHILYKHPIFERLKTEMFISKLCKETFANYAITQVKKARGLNKKIVNPIGKERKNLLHFCYILEGYGATPLLRWLENKDWKQEHCGLVNVPHVKNVYALFYDESARFEGIMKKDTSTDVSLTSVPKEYENQAYMFFNMEGYSLYCKEYKEYWEWVEKRNDVRYESTMNHGKNYDAKNMMHTFRLLEIAEEILETGTFSVKRPNRERLLAIKSGEFEYDDLIQEAESKILRIENLYASSKLPEKPDKENIEKILIQMRKDFYAL